MLKAASHEMVLVEGMWECSQCSRRFLFTDNGRLFLDRGDDNVIHFGSSGPVTAMDATIDVL